MDVHDQETRSKNMRAIKNRDTKPEHHVRKLLHNNGFRFRLCSANLPGKPDIRMAKYRTAIFIHGCFWHMHDCDKFRLPATRTEFWQKKLSENKARDEKNIRELHKIGIRTLIIRECALTGKTRLSDQILLTLIKTWLISGVLYGEITDEGMVINP
ncbi:very short patch repair endonuclease [Morganella psychrotolerans]|uniref:very short patch repair endonuclease n=1 Tax=Morganella psychrotolerans TaxID=368603 RepID=UPI0039AF3183